MGSEQDTVIKAGTDSDMIVVAPGQSLAMILDEAERNDSTGARIDTVIELVRSMSGAEGAHVQRGSAEGIARDYRITGAVYMSSILQGYLKPQDRSRITPIELEPLGERGQRPGADVKVSQRIREVAMRSPDLRARAIQGFPRFLVNLGVWRAALIGRGCDQRVADQLGTLLAGRDVLLYDEPSTGPAVADEIDRFEEWILAAMEDETEGEGREALNHLLGSQFENAPGTQRITISRALLDCYEPKNVDERRAIQAVGLRIEHATDAMERELWVARDSPGLARIFAGTRWERGAWSDGLRYLEGAGPYKDPAKFDGAPRRYTIIPGRHLPAEERYDNSSTAEDHSVTEK